MIQHSKKAGIKLSTYILLLSLLSILFSCQSEKAKKFAIQLDSTERKVFQIVSLDTLEEIRLQAFIARKSDLAQNIAVQQIRTLTDELEQLKQADVAQLPDAAALKESNIQYYLGFIELKKLDIQEAKLLKISTKDSAGAEQVIQQISRITGQRKKLYQDMNKADQLRQAAKDRFAKSNHLR